MSSSHPLHLTLARREACHVWKAILQRRELHFDLEKFFKNHDLEKSI